MNLYKYAISLVGAIIVLHITQNEGDASGTKIFLRQESPRQMSANLTLPEGAELGPVIPGLRQGAVPQGLAYSNIHDLLFISSYFEKKQFPSSVAVINQTTGRAIQTLSLKESDSGFHYGHVGGLAVDERFLWVASHEKVYQYELDAFLNGGEQQDIAPSLVFQPESQASFSTYDAGRLWVGEFVWQDSPYHSAPLHHTRTPAGQTHYAWICGYETSSLGIGKYQPPHYILSVRQKVQGIQWSEQYVFLSISWGRRNDSVLAVYRNPLRDPPQKHIAWDNGRTTPLWYLDETNLISETLLPPLAEGITMVNGKLAILFESGARKFQIGGKAPLDQLLLLDLHTLP